MLTLDEAKAVYGSAIDAQAHDGEGAAWWAEVADEVRTVVAAIDTERAAAVIAWWHANWRAVNDSPARAALRLRRAAARLSQAAARSSIAHVAR